MSQQVTAACKTFVAGGALGPYLRVKLSTGVLALAGGSDVELGTMEERALASGEAVPVRLRTAQGTRKMVSAGSITAGNPVYAAASGKVDASGSIIVGTALEDAAAGDIFEVLPIGQASALSSAGGTTASAFLVDSDASTPKIELAAQTAGTGDYKVSVKPPAALTGNRTHTLPADSDQTLVGTTATQTLTNKTLTSPTITLAVAVVAAAGSDQTGATALTASAMNKITDADDAKGVKLPAAAAGVVLWGHNTVADKTLELYPANGDKINGETANAAVTIPAKTGFHAVALDNDEWSVIFVPSA